MQNNWLDNFAAFILTNGRPKKVKTYTTLRRCGYTGRIFLIVDNLDKTQEQYKKLYGDEVIIFDKEEIAKTFDEADNFNDKRAIVYARNASFQVAKQLGIKYFIQLDDDYTEFSYRFNSLAIYQYRAVRNLDRVFECLLEFYKNTPITSIAVAQGGDFIGGAESDRASSVHLMRKCMNSFICSTDREFQFMGRINEDVNTYTKLASLGKLFFTTNQVSLNQMQTQSNSGGMTELYLDSGTYIKSFYTVMFQPSSVKVEYMQSKNKRLHHRVNWNNTVPKILKEDLKKK